MNDLNAGFHIGLRPIVGDRTRYTAQPQTPFNISKLSKKHHNKNKNNDDNNDENFEIRRARRKHDI